MKKFLYAVAALALFAGCAKDVNEATVVAPKEGNAILELNVSNDSRAVFDGDKHITWEEKDKIKALVADDLTATTAKSDPSELTFTGDDTKPTFKGDVKGFSAKPAQYYVFGVYPSSADVTGTYATTLEKRVVSLAASQSPSQSAWDGKADVMMIEPQAITGEESEYKDYDDDWNRVTFYKLTTDSEIKFAHLFGFGCISFASLPAEIADAAVSKFTISAIGDNKNLCGTFNVDLRTNVTADDFALTAKAAQNAIDIACDGTIALKDYKAWFVANPGTYDIAIDVNAGSNKIHFERKGLVIERAKIAKPVLNYKEADVIASANIDLTGGILWEHNTNVSYLANKEANFITSKQPKADWGTIESMKTMEFGISYSAASSVSASSRDNNSGFRVQSLCSSSLNNGTVAITSSFMFKGINNIMIYTGHTSASYSSNVEVFVIDKDGISHKVGVKQEVNGNGGNFYFNPTEALPEGKVQVVWSGASSNYANPFIGILDINPAPNIQFGAEAISVPGAGATGTVALTVDCATGEPVVKSDAEWLKVSYADGVITYTAEANDGDDARKANITVEATGNSTATNSIVVSQISSKYAEFSFKITPADIKAAIEAAAAAYETENGSAPLAENVLSFNAKVTATATDGSGLTKEVELYFHRLKYGSLEKNVFMLNGNYPTANTGYIQNVASLDMVTTILVGQTTQWTGYLNTYFGKDTDNLVSVEPVKNDAVDGIYPWTAKTSEANEYGFFRIAQASERDYAYIGATFITKK